MRRRFGTDYLSDEFDRLGAALADQTDVYLIGGGSMAFRDLKEATKDIDLVVEDRETLDWIQDALRREGYGLVRDPSDAYESLGAETVLENDAGCRFDLFVRQVGGELIFSDAMRDRCEAFMETGQLTVHRVSLEDIFLFKSVAGRTDDIEDLFTLQQTGLDFEAIEGEIDTQIELRSEAMFVTVINESLIELEDQFGATTPINDEIADRTARIYRELELLQSFDHQITVDRLNETTALGTDEIAELLHGLEHRGVIKWDGDTIEKVSENP